VPGGRVELPTNPESFRGCSTIALPWLKAGKLNLITLSVNAREHATDLDYEYTLSVEAQFACW